jgi:hypothetical protein
MVLEAIKNETLNAEERAEFWGNIKMKVEGGCWTYNKVAKDGYGYFLWRRYNGAKVPSHQMMCRELFGDWTPAGARICPQCRNCVNPSHIKTEDVPRTKAGTFSSRHPHSTLTAEQVADIRTSYNGRRDITQRQLAEKYGVSQGIISDIITKKKWRETSPDGTPITPLRRIRARTP